MDELNCLKITRSRLDFLDDVAIVPYPSPSKLLITLRQSEATLNLANRRSAARDKPSLHAIASNTSGSMNPSTTTTEAPKKVPSAERATAARAPLLLFLDSAASTFILDNPTGGVIHFGPQTGLAPTIVGLGSRKLQVTQKSPHK
jgi:hypothetical protein